MSRSNYQFDRWVPRSRTSWAWRVFKKHNHELMRMYTSFDNSKKFTYSSLGANGAKWEDPPIKHFNFASKREYEQFNNLKDWSETFNDLENWVNLNALVAISSNLETFIATIVPLALESDIGVLFGVSKRIDGIEIIKHGKDKPFDTEEAVESCTKGNWQSRLNSYKRVFGKTPKYLLNNISELEKIRIIRNNVAHSFGRDIKASRKKGELTTLPIKKLTRQQLYKLQSIAWKSAKSIDVHLNNFHIGEYQALLFYHELYPSLNHSVHPGQRAIHLKKAIGQHGDIPAGKEFCKGLVAYYEML